MEFATWPQFWRAVSDVTDRWRHKTQNVNKAANLVHSKFAGWFATRLIAEQLLPNVREHGLTNMEASEEAENAWVAHVNQVSGYTLFATANSWYVGANVPGKPRVFMPYIGGVEAYRQK